MKKQYFILFIISALLGCRKEIYVNLPDSERKIVLNAPLYEDSLISAVLVKSSHIQDGSGQLYTLVNADVAVYCNGQFLEKLDMIKDGYYASSENKVVAGNEYELRASLQPLAPVKGKTIIPFKPEIVKIDTGQVIENQYEQYFTFKTTINDKNPGLLDYYCIRYIRCQSYITHPAYKQFDTVSYYSNIFPFECNDPAVEFEMNDYGVAYYFTDHLFDGKSYTFEVRMYAYELNQDIEYIVAQVSHLSQDYYYYCKSAEMQRNGEDIPVFTQMVTVYNNIEGGYGIVGGLSSTCDSIKNKNFVYMNYNK